MRHGGEEKGRISLRLRLCWLVGRLSAAKAWKLFDSRDSVGLFSFLLPPSGHLVLEINNNPHEMADKSSTITPRQNTFKFVSLESTGGGETTTRGEEVPREESRSS